MNSPAQRPDDTLLSAWIDGELPPAAALVHPRLPGDYPFGELCGVGVAFKVAWAVCAPAS